MARPLGVKNNPYRAPYDIYKGIKKNIEIGTGKGLEKLAQPLVDEIAENEARYNDYTGNLVNSYSATVFVQRNPKKTVYHESGSRAVVHHTPNGAKWVYLTKERHGLPSVEEIQKTIQYSWGTREITYKNRNRHGRKSRKKRYLKRWEKLTGYRRSVFKRSSYSALGGGSAQAKNFIIVENQAPYADWVQRGVYNPLSHRRNHRYNVLGNSIVMRNKKGRMTDMIRYATIEQLKKAGFKVK